MSRDALVTIVLGAAYRRFYADRIEASHRRLAARLGIELVVLDRPIGGPVAHAHLGWQKLRVFEAAATARHDRLCVLDADLFVGRRAPSPFEAAEGGWLAVDNDTCGTAARRADDRRWYAFARPTHRPERLLNTGLLVLERGAHADLLRLVDEHHAEEIDQGPLSFHLLRVGGGTVAPPRFNCVVAHHLDAHGGGPRATRRMLREHDYLHFAAPLPLYPARQLELALAWDAADAARVRRLLAASVPSEAGRRATAAVRRAVLGASARCPRLAAAALSAPGVERSLRGRDLSFSPALEQRRLRRHLAQQRSARLLVSPHQAHRSGWACVDTSGLRARAQFVDKFRGRASPTAASTFTLGAIDAARALAPRCLSAAHLHLLLEALDEDEAAETLTGVRRALAPGGSLEVLAAESREDPGDPLHGRRGVTEARLRRALEGTGFVDVEIVGTDPERAATAGLPRGHLRARARA